MRKLLTILLILYGSVHSYFPQVPKEMENLGRLKAGEWLRYKMSSASDYSASELYIGVISADSSCTRKCFWIEIQLASESDSVVAKYLIFDNPRQFDMSRVILKLGNRPAMLLRFPNDQAGFPEKPNPEKTRLVFIGNETVVVPAGKFECKHYKVIVEDDTRAELWTNERVPLFSVVKSVSKTDTLVLSDYGSAGALELIKEKPIEMDLKQFLLEMFNPLFKDD